MNKLALEQIKKNYERLIKVYPEDQDIKDYYKRILFQLKWIEIFNKQEELE